MLERCSWAMRSPEELEYHDHEWGVMSHDDHHLFEMVILEGAQAGLSWTTVLRKREGYRTAFAHFDPALVANFDEEMIQDLLKQPAIIRNERKIRAAVQNARAFLQIQQEYGSFDGFLASMPGDATQHNHWATMQDVPAATPESDLLSARLKEKGFTFVGSTICYAFMQATGRVNDHITSCFRYQQR